MDGCGTEWKHLPLKLCSAIVCKVTKMRQGRDMVQALLETSKSMHEIAVSFIHKLHVKDFGDLERFPKRGRLEKLVLGEPYTRDDQFYTPEVALCWLLASPRARLRSIEKITLSIIPYNSLPWSNEDFRRLLGSIHETCPDCTQIRLKGEFDDPAWITMNPAFFETLDTFPGNLTVLDLWGAIVLPFEWEVVLPRSLQRLQAECLVGTDCIIRYLANGETMPCLKYLLLEEIKLSKGCVIDSAGCAWERLHLIGQECIDAESIGSFTEWPANVWCTTGQEETLQAIVKFGDNGVDLTRTIVERLGMWKWAEGVGAGSWHEQEYPRDAQEQEGMPSICFSWEGGGDAIAALQCLVHAPYRACSISFNKFPIITIDMIKAMMLVTRKIWLIECHVNGVELFLELFFVPPDRTIESVHIRMCSGIEFDQCGDFASTFPLEMLLDLSTTFNPKKLKEFISMRLGEVQEKRRTAGLPPFHFKVAWD